MTMPIPTRRWPECDECGYRSLDEDEFEVGDDDVFRCNVCDDEYKENCNGESTR